MTKPTALSPEVVTRLTGWFDETELVAPSISYAIFDRAGVLFHHGIGEFQLDGRAPAVDTIYRIASMSKSFCIAAVLVLRDRGLLSLDDRVSRLVPEFRDPVDAAGVQLPVTVHMLMSNSSGLPEDNGWADHELALSREDFLAVVAEGLGFAGRPGDGYQYSNVGFWLLGVIVENLSGQSFQEFATQTFLDPLGLDRTRYAPEQYPELGESGDGIAHGFTSYDKGASWVSRPVVGGGIGACAASMFSTPGDIARWSGWLSSAFDPANSDDTILSRASRREMQRVHTLTNGVVDREASPQLEGHGYGLGLNVEHDVRFGRFAQHSGGLPGWSSNMRWHLESGLGAVVFGNTNGLRLGIDATGMLRTVLDSLDAPAFGVQLWPATFAAARAVDEAVRGGAAIRSAEVAPTIFSPNLLGDVPAAVRDERIAAALAEVGGVPDAAGTPPLEDRLLWSVAPSHVAWLIPGATGELECRIELTPTTPPMLQRMDLAVRVPPTGQSPVTRHYLPVAP
ncbi:serine hydrolase [Agreia sp. COWG]|uniref:serine hydrolase domain-containing protein n=1 Tax=Agreia sp. COWG TaxID=2773266 RepID=UPI001927DA80|nr:serine hydrolase domain-containing protein [Agreia sp. COWG]CAD5991630.1 CubicO group peptidase, beta-lactamase class C family [Agreia sp. COWG]